VDKDKDTNTPAVNCSRGKLPQIRIKLSCKEKPTKRTGAGSPKLPDAAAVSCEQHSSRESALLGIRKTYGTLKKPEILR
jgi:hypothetical protein